MVSKHLSTISRNTNGAVLFEDCMQHSSNKIYPNKEEINFLFFILQIMLTMYK